MKLDKIYENIYKNTLPTTSTLVKLSEENKDDFANYLKNTLNATKASEKNELKTQKEKEKFPYLNLSPKNIDEVKLKEQTDAFEAFMIKSVLDVSLKTQNPLFGKDAGDDIYGSMYNDAISKALSGGLGFSKLLFDFLKERL